MIESDTPRRPRKSQGFQIPNVVFLAASIGLGSLMTLGLLLYVSVVTNPALLDYLLPQHRSCMETRKYSIELPDAEEDQLSTKQPNVTSSLMVTSRGEKKDRKLEHDEITGEPSEVPFKLKTSSHSPDSDSHKPLFSILIGIMTTAKKTERRHLLRIAYRAQTTQLADVEVKFVIGKMQDEADKILVGMENLVYGDIIELDCQENMNHGKTFTFFSSVSEMAEPNSSGMGKGRSYNYVMKTDDDSYVRVDNLARHLSPLARTDLYYGYVLPCENQDPYQWYMAGMGYVISWDLVEWIRESPLVRNNTDGTEDKLVGQWLNEGGKAKNRVNDKPLFYDHPAFGGKCSHELVSETILIHQVKTLDRWAHVLTFFEGDRLNVSLSKPYFIH
ncbi:hypothetical protein R1flu_024941 [Riccia fluitans]|uniref:Hexosyltransferase n=1 Tax=Riccia fluitans TaxID=41844 RepID=A0ABD1XWC5_9MARC